MGKTIVIYRSRTGFTERYAGWIAEELGGETLPYARRGELRLADCDTVLFGSSLHGGRIPGLKWFLEATAGPDRPRAAVFVTGATPPEAPALPEALRQNFTDEQWARLPVFYMQAGLCYERMGLFDRLLMSAFRSMLRKTEGEDSAPYRMVQRSYDLCAREHIASLVDFCRGGAAE